MVAQAVHALRVEGSSPATARLPLLGPLAKTSLCPRGMCCGVWHKTVTGDSFSAVVCGVVSQ